MQYNTPTIEEYLLQKGISFRKYNGELITRCLFSDCDKDSKGNEAHLYFNAATGQYDCKKCGAKGNLITLAKFLGDQLPTTTAKSTTPKPEKPTTQEKFDVALLEQCHTALPDRIKTYLSGRGISNDTINEYKLGWGNFYGQWWITIPIKDKSGQYKFFKLRQDPETGNKKITYPTGAEAQIYDWQTLKQASDMVVICEGELDRLLLLGHGVPAITSTHGALTFKDEWIKDLSHMQKVYVCFDNDEAGKKGAERILTMLQEKAEHTKTFLIELPEVVGTGGDITDYFTKHNGNMDELFLKLPKEMLGFGKAGRIIKVEPPEPKVTFEQWRQTIEQNFPELVLTSEICLAILAQILISEITNPFALVLVDVPAAGKTIAINFFSEIEGLTYATDKFTPASFVSNAVNVKKEKLKDVDLLPRLRYKTFLVRDLSTLFSKRDDDLNECLGLLTRVLDGEGLNTDSGVHGQRQYVGEFLFNMIAASTPIPPRVWKMMGSLGARLFFYCLNAKEKSEDELCEQLTNATHKDRERVCRQATKQFLLSLWHTHQNGVVWNKVQDKDEYKKIIARCAKLLAKLRGAIQVWKDQSSDGTEYSHNSPVIEMPNRINQLFYNLARGHALVCGRTQIGPEDLKAIIEITFDSAPTTRAKLIRALMANKGIMKTSEVEETLKCSKTTALKEMEALKLLEVCNVSHDAIAGLPDSDKTISLRPEFSWFLSEECRNLRGINNN